MSQSKSYVSVGRLSRNKSSGYGGLTSEFNIFGPPIDTSIFNGSIHPNRVFIGFLQESCRPNILYLRQKVLANRLKMLSNQKCKRDKNYLSHGSSIQTTQHHQGRPKTSRWIALTSTREEPLTALTTAVMGFGQHCISCQADGITLSPFLLQMESDN